MHIARREIICMIYNILYLRNYRCVLSERDLNMKYDSHEYNPRKAINIITTVDLSNTALLWEFLWITLFSWELTFLIICYSKIIYIPATIFRPVINYVDLFEN